MATVAFLALAVVGALAAAAGGVGVEREGSYFADFVVGAGVTLCCLAVLAARFS